MIGEIKSKKLHSRKIRSSQDHRTDKIERDHLQLPAQCCCSSRAIYSRLKGTQVRDQFFLKIISLIQVL